MLFKQSMDGKLPITFTHWHTNNLGKVIPLKERSAKECIRRILRDIDKRRNVDPLNFGDRNFVRRYNAAMDRFKENAYYLCEHYPEQMDLFIELVNSNDFETACHCAHLLYGMKNSTIEQKRLALSVVKRLVNHPDAPELTVFGMCANIRKWEAELAEQNS